MGISKNGVYGGISGKVGNAISYELNGQFVVRSLPTRVKKKPSPKEKANREKFAQMQAWLKPLLYFLKIGFKNYAPTFQGFTAAKSYNSKAAFKQNEDGTYFIDPAAALVSFGSLPLPKTMNMDLVGNEIVITWTNEGHYQGVDNAMVVAYVPAIGHVVEDFTVSKRYAGKAVLPLDGKCVGQEVHVYLAFVAYDQSAQSNSKYLGMVIP